MATFVLARGIKKFIFTKTTKCILSNSAICNFHFNSNTFCSKAYNKAAQYNNATEAKPTLAGNQIVSPILGKNTREVQVEFGQPTSTTHPHLLKDTEATPNISRTELELRRKGLVHLIRKHVKNQHRSNGAENHLCILVAAPRQYMTNDIPYVYHQNPDFNYFTGFLETNSILLLEFKSDYPSEDGHKSALFVETRDALSQLWEGPCSGIDGGKLITGVTECYDVQNFEDYLSSYMKSMKSCMVWFNYTDVQNSVLAKKVVDVLNDTNKCQHLQELRKFSHELRLYKSKAEQELMRESCEIASEAMIEVMRCSHPFVEEARLNAKMEYECKVRGASGLAYPPVIAGGKRANTIHYISNNQIIGRDELVLMDAGCEYNHYVSDITRTWPVTGAFTDSQRVLYEILHEVQVACIQLISDMEDVTLEQIHYGMLYMLGRKLKSAHIIPREVGDSESELIKVAQKFCPHHVGHYLGMDVHDTPSVSRSLPLKSGMCITIEPGIYVRDTLSDVPEEFTGIGLRIEDNVLITDSHNVEVLTKKCPKSISDVQLTVRNANG